MKIYTKTGDRGETGLFGGARVSKASEQIEAIGAVDEANAALGMVHGAPERVQTLVPWIQSRLFDVGAELASPAEGRLANPLLSYEDLSRLEASIDEFELELPPLRNFILPGGSEASSSLHVARAAVRRAERSVIYLSESSHQPVRTELMAFLNRLSDWAFTAARFSNVKLGIAEVPWTREGNR